MTFALAFFSFLHLSFPSRTFYVKKVSDPDVQLRRYSRDLTESLLGALPVETRRGVEASLVARKKSV